MTDKTPMPVSGDPASKGMPDGVSAAPEGGNVHGRSDGGESGGSAYPDPHRGKTGKNSGFFGHGGQTEIGYHGGGQAGDQGGSAPNGVTGSGGATGRDAGPPSPAPVAKPAPRTIEGASRPIDIVESSGVAQAEATGRIGNDPADGDDQPGSG